MEKTILFPGSFTSLDKISEFIENNARSAGFDDKTVYAIETAVDEAFSNIIDHAYGGENLGDIECTCQVNSEGMMVILRDHGQPFDPHDIADPILDCCLEDRTEHGLGLYVMRKLMDDVQFEFDQAKGNTLIMTKFFKEKP